MDLLFVDSRLGGSAPSPQWFLDNFDGTAGVIGTAILTDNFSGVDTLNAHTSDSGATWTDAGTVGAIPQLQCSGGLLTATTGGFNGSALSSVAHSSVGVVIDATIVITNGSGDSGLSFLTYFSSVTKYLDFAFDLTGGVLSTSISAPGGTGALVSAVISGAIANGSYTLRIVAQDGLQKLYWNGSSTPLLTGYLDLSGLGTGIVIEFDQSGAAGQQFSLDSLVSSNWDDGSLLTHVPDVGSAYVGDSNPVAPLTLSGSGALIPPSGTNPYVISTAGPPSVPYQIELSFTLGATGASGEDPFFDLILVDSASGDWVVEAYLSWDGSSIWTYLSDVVNSGSGFSGSNVDVTSLMTTGMPHRMTIKVASSGTLFELDDQIIDSTSQVPSVLPDKVEFGARSGATMTTSIDYVSGTTLSLPPTVPSVFDLFNDTDGTVVLVTPHTGEIGATWTLVPSFGPGATDEFVIQSNALQRSTSADSTGEALMYASGTLPGGTTQFTIEFGFKFDEVATGGSGAFIALYEKCDTSPSFIVQVGVNVLGASGLNYGVSFDGGTNVGTHAITNLKEYVAILTVNGTAISLSIYDNGTLLTTDSLTRGTQPTDHFGIDIYDGGGVGAAKVTYFKVSP